MIKARITQARAALQTGIEWRYSLPMWSIAIPAKCAGSTAVDRGKGWQALAAAGLRNRLCFFPARGDAFVVLSRRLMDASDVQEALSHYIVSCAQAIRHARDGPQIFSAEWFVFAPKYDFKSGRGGPREVHINSALYKTARQSHAREPDGCAAIK